MLLCYELMDLYETSIIEILDVFSVDLRCRSKRVIMCYLISEGVYGDMAYI